MLFDFGLFDCADGDFGLSSLLSLQYEASDRISGKVIEFVGLASVIGSRLSERSRRVHQS
jgi:hypothetical protein